MPEGESQGVSVEEMAAGYVRAVRAQQPHGPYLLVGVSFGGVLAYEIAQQLVRGGGGGGAGGHAGQHAPERAPAGLGPVGGGEGAARAEQWVSPRCPGHWHGSLGSARPSGGSRARRSRTSSRPRQRPCGSATSGTGSTARRRGGIGFVPTGGQALLVRAKDKSFFDVDISNPTYGWGLTRGGLDTCDIEGDHLSILREPLSRSWRGSSFPGCDGVAAAGRRDGRGRCPPPPRAREVLDGRAEVWRLAWTPVRPRWMDAGPTSPTRSARGLPGSRDPRFAVGSLPRAPWLRRILSRTVSRSPRPSIVVGAGGKPALPAGPQFNLSHSGDLALCVVAPSGAVGVDLEQIRPIAGSR